MIRQLDFLTGFASRAGRDIKRSRQRSGKTLPETDRLDALVRQAQGRDALRGEPALDDVLADPIVRQLMSSDDISSGDVMRVMGVMDREPDDKD